MLLMLMKTIPVGENSHQEMNGSSDTKQDDGDQEDDGVCLKARGNESFQKLRFDEAATFYTRALQQLYLKRTGKDEENTTSFYTRALQQLCLIRAANDEEKQRLDMDRENREQRRCAVLYSNRSACYFELGRYTDSIRDADLCLGILHNLIAHQQGNDAGEAASSSTITADQYLMDKNLYRLARAQWYSGDHTVGDIQKCLESLSAKKSGGGGAQLDDMALQMIPCLDYYRKLEENDATVAHTPSNTTAKAKQKEQDYSSMCMPFRTSQKNPATEYYPFGHDRGNSALHDVAARDTDENENSSDMSIYLDQLTCDELGSLSIFYGGVGDGRHAFCTVLDAHQQWRTKLGPQQQDQLHLHILANDINPTTMLKDILVLVLTTKMVRFTNGDAPDAEDCTSSPPGGAKSVLAHPQALTLALVIMYTTLSYAMPQYVYEALQQELKELFSPPIVVDDDDGDASTFNRFCKMYPHIIINHEDWSKLTEVAGYWIDPTKYEPKLPSTKHALVRICKHLDGSEQECLSSFAQNGFDGREFLRKAQENRSQKAQTHRDYMKSQLQHMSPEEMTIWRERHGHELSEQEIFAVATERIDAITDHQIFASDGQSEYNLSTDKDFLKATKTVFPFTDFHDIIPEMEREAQIVITTPDEKENRDPRDHIYQNWIVNPAKFDPVWHSYARGTNSDTTNPVSDWIDGYYLQHIRKMMASDPPDTSRQGEDALHNTTLITCIVFFYWNFGKALLDLDQRLTFEIRVGNVTSVCADIQAKSQERTQSGLPTKFQRMLLSNIPDYTGMLSIFVHASPLLADERESLCPILRGNCQLNSGIWATYDQYVYSTVGLTATEVTQFFGLVVMESDPTTTDPWTSWTRKSNNAANGFSSTARLQQSDIKQWLHRLFLMTVLPPERDSRAMIREERPSTMDLFLWTCRFCIETMDLPAHWIFSVLDDLLQASSSTSLQTKAVLVNESPPNIPEEETKMQNYNTSAFRLELEKQVSLFLQCKLLPRMVLATSNLVSSKFWTYALSLTGFRDTSSAVSSCYGFILEHTKNPLYNGDFGFLQSFLRNNTTKYAPRSNNSLLREDLLQHGENTAHVFSCCDWDFTTETVQFCMTESMFERYQSYSFSMIRTDSWCCILHNSARLGDARRCAS